MFDPKQQMITVKKADGTFAKVPLSEFKKMQAAPKPQATVSVIASHSEAIPNTGGANNGIVPISNIADPVRYGTASLTAPRNDNVKPVHHQVAHHPVKHHTPAHAPVVHHTDKHPAHHGATHHTKKSTINNIQYPISNKPHHVKKISRADASSLLEEKISTKSHDPLFSPKREKQVEMVIDKIGFNVAPDLLGRLKSLILAKLKDIKSEDEARELLSRSVKNGGLGLTEPQVEKVLQLCREAGEMEHAADSDVPVLKGRANNMALMVEPSELPAKPREVAPMPYNKIRSTVIASMAKQSQGMVAPPPKHGIATPRNTGLAMTQESDISKLIKQTAAAEPMFKLNSQAAVKKSMQDVSASAEEMGPVEEIKSTTLTDFRRLSGNPEEAARRLQQKMFNLQDESFILYLDALGAYHSSPLYGEYMAAVCQSLSERKSLANLLAMKNSIKLNEAMAIVEMERSL